MPEAVPTTYFENLLIQICSEETGLGNIWIYSSNLSS